jgi:hypothetical protein
MLPLRNRVSRFSARLIGSFDRVCSAAGSFLSRTERRKLTINARAPTSTPALSHLAVGSIEEFSHIPISSHVKTKREVASNR